MTPDIFNPPLLETISIVKSSSLVPSTEKDAQFIASLTERFSTKKDGASMIENLDWTTYAAPTQWFLDKYPKHAVAIVAINQPGWGYTLSGFLNEKSTVLVEKRSQKATWGGGTWTVPMGMVEPTVDADSDGSFGGMILNAAEREFGEVMDCGSSGARFWITGTFVDHDTGICVTTIVKDMGENLPVNQISVLPSHHSKREKTGWLPLNDTPNLSPMLPGSKQIFLSALNAIGQTNHKVSKVGV